MAIDLKNSVVGQALQIPQKEQWAILDHEHTSQTKIDVTSFLQLEVVDDGTVVSVPVEEGSFAAYNKTDHPAEIKLQVAKQGKEGDLQKFVKSLEELRKSVDLVDIITPTTLHESLTLEKFDFQLTREDGRGVLYAELTFLEVRQVEAQYTDEKLAPVQDRGKTQTKKAEIKKEAPKAKPGTGYRKPQDPKESMASKIGLGKLTGLGRG